MIKLVAYFDIVKSILISSWFDTFLIMKNPLESLNLKVLKALQENPWEALWKKSHFH
jgi:hypothetical protein